MSGPEGEDETNEAAVISSSYPKVEEDIAEEENGQDCAFGYDACGAMDLSSCASSKAPEDTDTDCAVEDEDLPAAAARVRRSMSSTTSAEEDAGDGSSGCRKRRNLEKGSPRTNKRKRLEDSGGGAAVSAEEEEEEEDVIESGEEERSVKSLPPKIRNKRRNIKTVIEEEQLEAETRAAKAEEAERLTRLAEQQKQLFLEVSQITLSSLSHFVCNTEIPHN